MNTTAEPPTAVFAKIRADFHRDRDGWSWVFVIAYEGALEKHPEDPTTISDEETQRIFAFCREHEYHVQPEGSGVPGKRYANQPWIDIFPTTIVVRQSGGLDT